MSVRWAIGAGHLHDEAFPRDPFPVGLGSHFCAGYRLSRLEARERLVRLFHDRRPSLAEPLPPLRMGQYHLTVPWLRVTLTEGGLR